MQGGGSYGLVWCRHTAAAGAGPGACAHMHMHECRVDHLGSATPASDRFFFVVLLKAGTPAYCDAEHDSWWPLAGWPSGIFVRLVPYWTGGSLGIEAHCLAGGMLQAQGACTISVAIKWACAHVIPCKAELLRCPGPR